MGKAWSRLDEHLLLLLFLLLLLCFRILKDVIINLIFDWPCIIDINNLDSQLDATITVY